MDASARRLRFPDGVTLILIATAVAGGCGYVANLLVGGSRPAAEYAVFGVFWSALYLIIAALSGIQQEVTRASHLRRESDPPSLNPVRNFGIVAGIVVGIAVLGSGLLWGAAVFPEPSFPLVFPIAAGGASYVIVAVLAGSLYGVSAWRPIAVLMVVDGVLRLMSVVVVIAIGGGTNALAWAVALPFPLSVILVWWYARRFIVGRVVLDVGLGTLVRNVLSTVVASVATGVLISGFPLVMRLTSPAEPAASIGALIFAVNLIRAPLVIVVLSLQSYLVVRFRNAPADAKRVFVSLSLLIVGAATVASLAAWFVVPPILAAVPGDYGLNGWVIAGLVATSGLLGVLCVSGPLALARAQHHVYTAGWVSAALASIVVMIINVDLSSRVVLALAVGPSIGVAVHLIGISRRR
ncbi:hypothetical protein [Glaciibacter flavus]|uniref:hypothetical protein n=1 Tax=Orlajensenia flava TaxID=2565934 RepID=UPI003AFFF1AC